MRRPPSCTWAEAEYSMANRGSRPHGRQLLRLLVWACARCRTSRPSTCPEAMRVNAVGVTSRRHRKRHVPSPNAWRVLRPCPRQRVKVVPSRRRHLHVDDGRHQRLPRGRRRAWRGAACPAPRGAHRSAPRGGVSVNAPLALAFTAGMVATVNPCRLPCSPPTCPGSSSVTAAARPSPSPPVRHGHCGCRSS